MAPLLFFLMFALVIDLYAYQAVRTLFETTPFLKSAPALLYWSVSLGIYAILVVAFFSQWTASPGMKRLMWGAVICVGMAKLFMVGFMMIDDVFRLFKWLPSFFYRGTNRAIPEMAVSRSTFLSQMAILSGGLAFGLFSWGMIRTAYQYKVRRQLLAFPGLPENFKGLKILQISDLHLGSFVDTKPVEKAVKIINDLEADLVFFTGDLVNSVSVEAEPFIESLSSIKSTYGTFSVLGNHDYGHYHRWETEEAARQNMIRMREIHRELGWTLLDNEHRMVEVDDARIAVIGVENWGSSEHFPKKGDIDKAKAGLNDTHLRLLMSHDPSHWNYIVSQEHPDIDVTFSGHTHGFQMGVEIPQLKFKWSPAQYVYKQWAGLYQQGKQHLYVNRGLGFIGYQGRVGILPEITLMEISRAQA